MSVRIEGDDFVVHSFANDDPIVCRDYVRSKTGLEPWKPKPNGSMNGAHSHQTLPEPVHDKRGVPDVVYRYHDAYGSLVGIVCRWEARGGKKKVFAQARPKAGKWDWSGLPKGSPLYGLAMLNMRPDAKVIIVEGEKCVEVAQPLFQKIVFVSWFGGAHNAKNTDWSPLRGRNVIVWPDNDKSGDGSLKTVPALAHQAGAASVRIVDLDGDAREEGWDIADAIKAGWTVNEIVDWIKPRAKDWTAPDPEEPLVPAKSDDWKALLINNEEARPKPRVTSNFQVLARWHPETKGVLGWHEVTREIYLVAPPPWHEAREFKPRSVTSEDVTQMTYWLEHHGVSPKVSETHAAMAVVAHANPFNPVRDYLNALVWDGVPRITTFPAEIMGTPDHPIYATFWRRWMVSAVARVMRPGCKADCMIVLEGDQGTMKSSMLRCLATVDGVEYFTDAVHDIESKDAALQMQGIWIAEVAELNALQKKGPDSIKAWLSRSTDRFRPPYDRVVIEVPRSSVIAGTLNPIAGYMNDASGARRFWPIPVKHRIDIARVTSDRDQLWAEAVALYRDGEAWHLTDEEGADAAIATADRYADDPWDHVIDAYVRDEVGIITLPEIIRKLGIPNAQQTQATSRRIGARLRYLGYEKKSCRQSPDGYDWRRKDE